MTKFKENPKSYIEEMEKLLNDANIPLPTNLSLPIMISIPDRCYKVSETPITVEQYRTFIDATKRKQTIHGSANEPVVFIKYQDCLDFCVWLSNKTGQFYRLLSEDEWDYCCADHQYADPKIAVYGQNKLTNVKTKRPNSFGLYDMLGLVWEQTSSLYSTVSHHRVVRGGCWNDDQRDARCAYRRRNGPVNSNLDLGFRVLCIPNT